MSPSGQEHPKLKPTGMSGLSADPDVEETHATGGGLVYRAANGETRGVRFAVDDTAVLELLSRLVRR